MNIYSIKNFDTDKLFCILKIVGIVYEEINETRLEFPSRVIKNLIEDSDLLYWKYYHIVDGIYEKEHFRIVGYTTEGSAAVGSNGNFWNLELGEEWNYGRYAEDNEIEFSKKLKDVFPEINKIQSLQMFVKLVFQIYKNKILWSPKSLGGKYTKKQLERLFLKN
jgi:hypothetical protein